MTTAITIHGLGKELSEAILKASTVVQLEANTQVFRPGMPCQSFLIVVSGCVKVQQTSESGREIVLYRVQEWETCLLTTACLLSREDYSVSAYTETPVTAVSLPAPAFNQLLSNAEEMRQFVFNNYGKRMSDFMLLVQEIAFESLEQRLSHRLLSQADANGNLAMTHQDLASELGSTREVISRKLKEFERLNWIKLHRGRIEITDPSALE